MIQEEYAENKDGSQYAYLYYLDNEPSCSCIVNKGKIVSSDNENNDFLKIVKKDCGFDKSISRFNVMKYNQSKNGKNINFAYNNQVVSLSGSPQEVSGYFSCYGTNITSLEGAPQEVGEAFDCSYTKITSLEGAPQKVGDFICSYTNITSLEGAPQKVNRYFDCSGTKITNLKGAPKKVGGDFYCSYTKITKEQAIEYLRNNDCERIVGDFGEITKDSLKESCFNY